MANITEYKEAIPGTRGLYVRISENLGITRQSVSQMMAKHTVLKDLADQERRKAIDHASDTIYTYSTMDDKSDPRKMAIKLKASERIVMTQGKDEGWVEKQITQHEGSVSFDSAENLRKIWEEENADSERDTTTSDT